MSNRILFKRISQCVLPVNEKSLMKSFSIWSNGSFYYEYKDFDIPKNCETDSFFELLKFVKIRNKKKELFN